MVSKEEISETRRELYMKWIEQVHAHLGGMTSDNVLRILESAYLLGRYDEGQLQAERDAEEDL